MKNIGQYQSFIGLLFIGVAGLILALTGKIDASLYWGFLTLNFGAFTISHEVRKGKERAAKTSKIEQQNINMPKTS